jgi:steroid delta-isomerase-like uncharacterized protein
VARELGLEADQARAAERVVASYLDAFNRGDLEALAALYAPSTVYVNPFSPRPVTSPSAVRDFETPMFAAFGEVGAEVVEMIADGDRAAARVVIRARHTGELQSPGGAIPATGNVIELHSAEFVRVDTEGRIVEHHRFFDAAAFLAQLGLV